MKKISILILFTLFEFTGNAQTWQWAKDCISVTDTITYNTFGDGSSIAADPAGNVFICGVYQDTLIVGTYTLFPKLPSKFPYLIKYDANGNALWARSGVSTSTAISANWGVSVCSDAGGNAIMTGFFTDPIISFGTYTLTRTGKCNMFVVKYDPNGNVLWAKTPTDTCIDRGYSVSSDATNNIYVAGTFSNSSIVFGTNTLTSIGIKSMFLVKYDPNGNALWAKNSSAGDVFEDIGEFAVSVSAETNGTSFVAGTFKGSTIVFGTHTLTNNGIQNIYMVKYDASGNVLWAKSAGGAGAWGDNANSVNTDGIGNAYVTGFYSSSSIAFGTYTLTNSGVNENMYLVKYDANGNVLWAKNSGGAGFTGGLSVNSNSNTVFITGKMDDVMTLGSQTLAVTSDSVDPTFIAQYDANGNLMYSQAFPSGGDDWFAVCLDKSCNAYFTGDFDDSAFVIGTNTLIISGGETIFTAKFSYSATSVCQSTIDNPTGVKSFSNLNSGIEVYPNPNSGSFKIKMDNEIQNGELVLMNSLGKIIHEQKISRGENNITTNKISSGLYYYVILQNKQQVGNGKLIIE